MRSEVDGESEDEADGPGLLLHCGLGALPTLACVDLTNDNMRLEI